MIAIQKIGKNFMGALSYNLKKLQLPELQRAKLLYSSFAALDKSVIRSEMEFAPAWYWA
ncbi:hypothetical protein [Mucilaginibacter terrenus]|uniref:hypothetical protein n=1 Tax=Mucilaginibacter terrenus TaxID=2482727 RepID=UPI001403FEA3|nr:hypothetical protein [Mucilaginibacter terrenus]